MRVPFDKRDLRLLDHLAEEFGSFGSAAVEFLVTADEFLSTGDPFQQPRLAEATSYCVREALKRILDSVDDPGSGRWQTVSRQVTRAKAKYERARTLPGEDAGGALAELLQAVDRLDDFHQQEGLHERRVIAVLVGRTGSRPLEANLGLVVEYQGLINDLNLAVHDAQDMEFSREGFEHGLRLLRGLFLPPDLRLEDLDILASIEAPSEADATRLREIIVTPSHLEYLFGRAESADWLSILGYSDLTAPPEGQANWPVYRLQDGPAGDQVETIARWLDGAYDEWGGDAVRARYLVRAAADLGEAGHPLLVRGVTDHQTDSGVCHTVAWAIRDVDPSDAIIVDVADFLLNEGSGLERISLIDADRGVLRQLIDGVSDENVHKRLELLGYKLRSAMAGDHDTRYVLEEQAGSISRIGSSYREDHLTVLLVGFVGVVRCALEVGVDSSVALDVVGNLGEPRLIARLRAWVLATAPDVDLAAAATEIAEAIKSRRPTGDDLLLVDRVVEGLQADAYLPAWSEAIGDPMTAEEVAAALSDHSLDPWVLQRRDWSGVLPAEAWTSWTTLLSLVAGSYGPVTRERFEHRPRVEVGTGRSPMTVDEILALDPADAAVAISAWRPDPAEWLVGARELARATEGAVKMDPGRWVRDPMALVIALHEPVYISHYLRGVSDLEVDLSDIADELVQVVATCRAHPWDPTAIGRDDFDYDPDWRGVDQAGVQVLKALADKNHGFGGRGDQAWELVASAARDRAEDSSLISPREDPMETAINRPCTRALEAAVSLMAHEFREREEVRQDALALMDEALEVPGWDGAEHRAIVAPRLGFLLHVVPDWVTEREELLIGSDAPEGLGQVTIDMVVKWGRPNPWIYQRTRDGILDAVERRVENALAALLVGMLWSEPGYEPETLAAVLGDRDPQILSGAGESLARLLRDGEVAGEHVNAGTSFWRAVLERANADELPGFGWWAEVTALDDGEWEKLMLETARTARGRLDWSHAVAERVALQPISATGLAILNELVRGQVDEWDRMTVTQSAVDAIRDSSESLGDTPEFGRLRTTLIERGRFDARDL